METPTDQVTQPKTKASKAKRKAVAARGRRKRVLGAGEGDYCIYEIVSPDGPMPKGTLIPIPNVPRFTHTIEAMKWIRGESRDLLAGKQVMIFRAMEILSIRVTMAPTVVIDAKTKTTVTDPSREDPA